MPLFKQDKTCLLSVFPFRLVKFVREKIFEMQRINKKTLKTSIFED